MSEESEENNKEKDFMYYTILQSAIYGLHNKMGNPSLTKEEIQKYLKELIPMEKELDKELNKRRAEGKKQITYKMIKKDLKKKGIPPPKMSDDEIIAKLNDKSLTKEERKLYIGQIIYIIADLIEKWKKPMKRKDKKRLGKPFKPEILPKKDWSLPEITRIIVASGKVDLKEEDKNEKK